MIKKTKMVILKKASRNRVLVSKSKEKTVTWKTQDEQRPDPEGISVNTMPAKRVDNSRED